MFQVSISKKRDRPLEIMFYFQSCNQKTCSAFFVQVWQRKAAFVAVSIPNLQGIGLGSFLAVSLAG